jgi:hypothetical protein
MSWRGSTACSSWRGRGEIEVPAFGGNGFMGTHLTERLLEGGPKDAV